MQWPVGPREVRRGDELPDYPPPFADVAGGDASGNLWIREFDPNDLDALVGRDGAKRAGGSLYDVIDRSGRMIDRVHIPGGTSLQAWGPGVVYLTSRDGATTSLVRARIR